MHWAFDNTYARELPWLGAAMAPVPVREPRLLFLNRPLAVELGLDPSWFLTEEGAAVLAGSAVPEGAEPIAQAYAGHQFGQFSPRLGDGRAHLLGEVVDREGRRRDIALKGSGRTVFSRGGDGRAAIGPVLREVIVSEAMAALGVPTTRALAAAETGEQVWRDTGPERGAVLTRVAASHLRVGTLELVRTQGSLEQLRALVDYVRERHDPHLEPGDIWGLFDTIAGRQAELVAQWMSLGFIHGVMNTDNMALSGETIDYGPCAFVDRFDPDTVYSSIDTAGRYRYSSQPAITGWNLARLAESLLPLVPGEPDEAVAKATERVNGFAGRYAAAYRSRMAAKLGLGEQIGDVELDRIVGALLEAMRRESLDYTGTFRALARSLRGAEPPAGLEDWVDAWRPFVAEPEATATRMDAVNPAYIPRNHLVEEALDAARQGDLKPFERLVEVLRSPFVERPEWDRYAQPAPERFAATYVTFCGT
ncbi:MAG: YdiU family protein [Intrasporangiaceae bacterium]|nr:YdiU family protein [Intrasporangiaceae bacterium]